MNWDNYAEYWHIDHTIPLTFFDLTSVEQQRICFNWTNLRPLEKNLNMSKCDSIIEADIIEHKLTLQDFVEANREYQPNIENCWWRRLELRQGEKLQDAEDFISLLKWAICSQTPNIAIDEITEQVQRLDVSGLEVPNQHL